MRAKKKQILRKWLNNSYRLFSHSYLDPLKVNQSDCRWFACKVRFSKNSVWLLHELRNLQTLFLLSSLPEKERCPRQCQPHSYHLEPKLVCYVPLCTEALLFHCSLEDLAVFRFPHLLRNYRLHVWRFGGGVWADEKRISCGAFRKITQQGFQYIDSAK